MDLFSQAEHHETSQAILISPDRAFIERVEESIERSLADMSRAGIIEKSLHRRGALIKVKNLDEACEIANRIAPEHWSSRLRIRGNGLKKSATPARFSRAVHLGGSGDYCAGPNHVLPTSRTARFSSPLGVYDFQKRSSIISVSRKGRAKARQARHDPRERRRISAHARSAELRFGKTLKGKA